MDQRSPEWYEARRGKVTASRIADVLSRTKSGWGSSRGNYQSELLVERLGGSNPSFTSPAMQWGLDKEAEARDAYSFYTGADVALCGFIDHPAIDMSGASPDGLVGSDGLLEIKCPNSAQHIDTLLGESIAQKYMSQIYWQLACTGRQWCDFASYDPRLPEDMRLFVHRIQRDDKTITMIEKEVTLFIRELETKLASLKGRLAA
jgi:putative phage-type endonuclease